MTASVNPGAGAVRWPSSRRRERALREGLDELHVAEAGKL
jgi:hypothetical protein